METYPGVTIVDMGSKLGMNGIDNGVLMLDHYRIPRENLLNKTGDVSPSGQYTTTFKDPNKRFGASLGALLGGRVGIGDLALANTIMAITIAIR